MIGDLRLVRSPMSQTLYDIPLRRIDGSVETLAASRGKVLLIVNVASKCGLTPQYEGLEQLYRRYRDAGLDVLGFPANDFAGQEPGSDEEIAQFCSTSFDVSFPLYAKTSVVGAEAHPLYRQLTAERPDAIGEGPMRQRLADYGIAPNPLPQVLWNFEKFLVGRDGRVLARFAPDVTADDPRLTDAIESALAAPG
jgi:glutathione peroxidase